MKHEISMHRAAWQTRVDVLDAEALQRLDAEAWDSLSANALDENPFYARQFGLAGLRTIDHDTALEALAVYGQAGELIGLFPFRLQRLPFLMAESARNLYQPSCMPLIHRRHAREAVEAWLDALGGEGLPRFWQFRHVDLASRFMQVLDEALAERGWCNLAVNAYQRPHLTRIEGGLEAHRAQVLAKRRLKDIARNLKRLRALGSLRFERAVTPDLVARRLEQFLTLEKASWKGRAGTALLCNEDSAAFARQAFAPAGDAGRVSIDSLLLDEKPIAMSLSLRGGETAFTPKCAYDEAYRKYSPGLVLETFIIEAFYGSEAISAMDAATTTDGHVLADFWNGWKPMGSLIVGPDSWQTRALAVYAISAHRSREQAKRALGWGPMKTWARGLTSRSRLKGNATAPWWAQWEIGLAVACAMAALAAE